MPYHLATPAILRHYFIINKVIEYLEKSYQQCKVITSGK